MNDKSKKIKKVIYSALKIDKNDIAELLKNSVHPIKYGEHVTLNYIGNNYLTKETPYAGEKVNISLKDYYVDENGEAFTVNFNNYHAKEIASPSQLFHVTISCNNGIKPFYSNQLINNTNNSEYFKKINISSKIAYFVEFEDGSKGWIVD